MAPTASPWTTRRDLLWAPRKLALIHFPYTVPLFTKVHNSTTGALEIPDDGFVIGLHSKQRGGALANAQTLNDIMSHGVAGPSRQIATERRITLGVEPQETHRVNLENYWGADWSGVTPDASGAVTLHVPELPLNRLGRTIALGKDDWNGLPIYIAWLLPRTNISETGEQGLTDPEVATYPYTLNAQGEDALLGEPMIIDIFGAGWNAVNERADTGFYSPITAITLTPATATLSDEVGAPENDLLLAVEDSNERDRTASATYTTSDAAVATVTSAGVVRGVAPGTATITATLNGQTDTCAVTVAAA
jgi:hypothetical protein